MATKTVVNAGGNYSTDATWSPSGKPTSVDDVVFTGTSGQLTVDVASAAKSIDFTGYTSTITFNATLTVSGNVTLVAGFSQAGTAGIIVNATATLTSNTVTWTQPLTISNASANNPTVTLADNWTVSGQFNHIGGGSSANTTTVNGNRFDLSGNMTNGTGVGFNGQMTGTTVFRLKSGSLTFNLGVFSGAITSPVQFDGNITVGNGTTSSAAIRLGGSITWVSGTIDCSNSFLVIQTGNATINTGNHVTWNIVTFGGNLTHTLSSDFYCTGLLTLGNTSSTVINGAFNLNASGGVTINQGNASNVTGTATLLILGGTVTGSASTSELRLNTTFAGDCTISSSQIFRYGTGTLTYSSGTITCGTSTLLIGSSCTLDTNGIQWNDITAATGATTITLNSLLRVLGVLTFRAAITLAGTSGAFDANTFTCCPGGTVTFLVGKTYRTRNALNISGTATQVANLVSSTPSSAYFLNLDATGTQEVVYVSATDVNSGGGQAITNFNGSDTRTVNWSIGSLNPSTVAYTFFT